MAQIQYDEDDTSEDSDTPQWRRRLVVWVLAAIGLGLGFLIPYTLYLNHQVSERFGQLRWQIPTRVYARPLQLAPGLTIDATTLKTELDAAAYHAGEGYCLVGGHNGGTTWYLYDSQHGGLSDTAYPSAAAAEAACTVTGLGAYAAVA